jgi:hypothetical protein
MLSKVLAWSSFASALLFAVLAVTGLFAWDALGETAPMLIWFGAIPLLGLSILLAIALLVCTTLFPDA